MALKLKDREKKLKQANRVKMPPASKSIDSKLLSLPLELRLKGYHYILETGEFDRATKTHVVVVKERRPLRLISMDARTNNYALSNCTNKYPAITQTCRQIFDEVTAYVAKPSFKFTSAMAFATFVGYRPWIAGSRLDDCKLALLKTTPKVMVVVNKERFSGQHLRCFAYKMQRPLSVQFVDEKGDCGRELQHAIATWQELVESL